VVSIRGDCLSYAGMRCGNMWRSVLVCLVTCALATGCAAPPVQDNGPRYCSVATHVPCLVQQRTANCQPCPGQQ
jgi:hypothetical protein